MSFSKIKSLNLKPIAILFSGALVMVSFQNCGQAGFENSSLSSQESASNQAYAQAPHPLDVRFNQIAYMSCPRAGTADAGSGGAVGVTAQGGSGAAKTVPSGDLNDYPYFTLRAAGFDNSDLLNSPVAPGGVGFSPEGLEFVRNTLSPAATPQSLAYFLKNSPFTKNKSIVSTILLKNRTPQALTPPESKSFPILEPLSAPAVSSMLTNAPAVEKKGTQKVSFFSQSPTLGLQNFAVSMNFMGDAVKNIRTNFTDANKKAYLFLGYADATSTTSAASIVNSLSGPDNDPVKRLYGKGYELTFSQNKTGFNSVMDVQEVDLSKTDEPVNVSQTEGQAWECLPPLTVVRPVDRIYKLKNDSFVRKTDINAEPSRPYFIKNGFQLRKLEAAQFFGQKNPLRMGIQKVCPPQEANDLDSIEMRDKWRIVRRMLPADLFDLNLKENCVVPTEKALASGQTCYASGDADTGKYIVYDSSFECGPSPQDECSAFVSVCYRKK